MSNDPAPPSEYDSIVRQERLRRVCMWLVFAQFLAAPALLIRSSMPPVIGIGWFSIAVDFRYLAPLLLGASFANLILLPFVFAWSHQKLRWRVFVCIPMIVVAGITNVVYPIVASLIGVGQLLANFPFRELGLLLTFILITVLGFTVIPLAIRIYRGWHVTAASSLLHEVSRRDRYIDIATLVVVVLLIFLVAPFTDGQTGLGVLSGFFGIFLGGIVAVPAFWLMRDISQAACRILFALAAISLVVVPLCFVWLADISRVRFLPVGSGVIFLGVATAAAVLLVHVFLFRAMGLRMYKLPFEKTSEMPRKKEVVDPFSD